MRASDKAYAALRDDIIEWRLLPGTVLAEVEQSARLGISRTPLREALSRLTAEGLTTTAGGRGVVVTDISWTTSTNCSNCAKPSRAGPPPWRPSAATPQPSMRCGANCSGPRN